MAHPSKKHNYLTQSVSFIPWPFYGIVLPWSACLVPEIALAKNALFTVHTSKIGKVKLAKPRAGQKINPCQFCEAKFSVSSGDPLSYLLP